MEEKLELLNKWKSPTLDTEELKAKEIPSRMVYLHNRTRAANSGLPSVLELGKQRGLTDHETATVFGWTTGDYRFVNRIAKGFDTVEYWEYPWLPQELTKVQFSLTREEVLPYVHTLERALSKLTPDQQPLWRGHRGDVPKDIGSQFELKGFISTTRDREKALEFCVKTTPETIPGQPITLLAILKSHRGKCVAKLSARPSELEVLFPPGTLLEVVEAPAERHQQDLQAVQDAAKKAGADIDLIYAKEVRTGP